MIIKYRNTFRRCLKLERKHNPDLSMRETRVLAFQRYTHIQDTIKQEKARRIFGIKLY